MAYKFIGKIKTLHNDANRNGKATFFYSETFKCNDKDYGIAYNDKCPCKRKNVIATRPLCKDRTFMVKQPLLCFLSQHSSEQLIVDIDDNYNIIGVTLSYE